MQVRCHVYDGEKCNCAELRTISTDMVHVLWSWFTAVKKWYLRKILLQSRHVCGSEPTKCELVWFSYIILVHDWLS